LKVAAYSRKIAYLADTFAKVAAKGKLGKQAVCEPVPPATALITDISLLKEARA